MTWHEAYKADKQCKLETRISSETKEQFDKLCAILGTKTSTLLRDLVGHMLEQYAEELQ
jgi:predicted DNA-binding protein